MTSNETGGIGPGDDRAVAAGQAAADVDLLESVSALMDNEVDELTTRRLLRTLTGLDAEQGEAALGRWHRFHLARAVMTDPTAVVLSSEFEGRLKSALADEPLHRPDGAGASSAADPTLDNQPLAALAAQGKSGELGRASWRRSLGAVAVAASMALAAVIVSQSDRDDVPDQVAATERGAAGTIERAPTPRSSGAAPYRPAVGQSFSGFELASVDGERRARSYMLHHAQQTGMSLPNAGVGFIKVAAYR